MLDRVLIKHCRDTDKPYVVGKGGAETRNISMRSTVLVAAVPALVHISDRLWGREEAAAVRCRVP